MKKICIAILLSLILMSNFSMLVLATSPSSTTEAPLPLQDMNNSSLTETTEVIGTEVPAIPEDEGWFSSIDIAFTISSLVITVFAYALIFMLCRKELAQKEITFHTLILFLLILVSRFLVQSIDPSHIDLLVVVSISLLYVSFLIFYTKKLTNNPKSAAIRYIKGKINTSHPCIEAIQLYSYVLSTAGRTYEYELEYIDGSRRKRVEINASIGLTLHLDNATVGEIESIMDLYKHYLNPESKPQVDTYEILLKEAITNSIKRLKDELSKIKDVKDVQSNECCLARVLVLNCALLASLDKDTSFVGFGNEALGIPQNIEHALYTNKRTGVLGAILLQDLPYIFYYNGNGDKAGRTYCAFVCHNEDCNYLVLIALRQGKNNIVPNPGITNALLGIKKDITQLLEFPGKEVADIYGNK